MATLSALSGYSWVFETIPMIFAIGAFCVWHPLATSPTERASLEEGKGKGASLRRDGLRAHLLRTSKRFKERILHQAGRFCSRDIVNYGKYGKYGKQDKRFEQVKWE